MSEHHTPDDVRALLRKHGITGSMAELITGVSSRTVRSWQAPTGSSSFRPIPEPAWRLLQLYTGEIDATKWREELREIQSSRRQNTKFSYSEDGDYKE